MAEIMGLVGLVASVLQLVDTMAGAHRYIMNFRDAPKDQQRLLLEIQSLEPLVKELENRIKSNQAAGLISGLQEFDTPLIQLKRVMERLAQKLDSSGISKVSNRVVWPLWGKEDIEEGLNTIERFKSLLNTWLGMDIWISWRSSEPTVAISLHRSRISRRSSEPTIANLVQEHKVSHNQTLASLKDATEDQRIGHNYIAKSIRDVVRNQEHSRDSAEAAERAEIIDWLSPINFFLRQADILSTRQRGTGEWLLGNRLFNDWKSKTGSTMWCRGMLVDNLRATLESRSMRAAVIYLNYKETEAQSPSNLLAGLWRQLVFDRPISPAVRQLYAKHREQRTRPSLEEIGAILCSTISELSKVFIIVDALDEYPEQHRSILLRHLSSLATGSTVSLMLTSRPHININYVAENLQILEIRATEDDIRRYIDAAVLKSSRLSKHIENNSSLREEIEEIIVRRSDGMWESLFLLAKLQVDSLMTKHTIKAVRNALHNMPDNLNSSYDEIVDRINRQSEDDKALAWHTILSVCASLVVINEADMRLRLIHSTTQSYLEQVQSTIFPHAATEITATCITYLSFDVFSRNEHASMPLFRRNPFLKYAVEYCLIHARGLAEVRIKQLILAFLADCLPWWQLWNWRHAKRPKSKAKLWIASLFRLKEICRDLIQEDGQIDEAARDGLTDILRLLIYHDVDVNTKEANGTALDLASGYHYDVVKLLIEHGADVNAQCGHYGSILQAASLVGQEDIFCMLIEHGADVNAQGGSYGSALQAACTFGHKDIVKLLIEHGADVNAQGGEYGSALQAACWAGHKNIVKLLIERGADINAQGGSYGSALQAACWAGHKDIVCMLIEHGANINTQGGEYGNALQHASAAGRGDVVCMLIVHGADVNAQGGKYGSALQVACWAGYKDVVCVLIEHGADVNAQGGEYGSALQLASRAGHKDVGGVLIAHGADVNAQGGEYGSALQAASKKGHNTILSLLIEHGADVNAQGGHYGSALQGACWAGHKDIVSALIEHGANVNAQGGHFGSALQAASRGGREDIVSLLIEHGADVDAQYYKRRAPEDPEISTKLPRSARCPAVIHSPSSSFHTWWGNLSFGMNLFGNPRTGSNPVAK
ncbi:ankyrin repeat-containing domain protein [Mycena latifolia]|nr:ankyrin repeat-containing domain protein [Mycena latifolia]